MLTDAAYNMWSAKLLKERPDIDGLQNTQLCGESSRLMDMFLRTQMGLLLLHITPPNGQVHFYLGHFTASLVHAGIVYVSFLPTAPNTSTNHLQLFHRCTPLQILVLQLQ